MHSYPRTRRKFSLKYVLLFLIVVTTLVMIFRSIPSSYADKENPITYKPTWSSIDQRPTPSWWMDAKFGIFIHWGVYSVPGWAPVGQYAEWYWEYMEKPEFQQYHKEHFGDIPYSKFAQNFTAEYFNPDEWAELFLEAGAKYVVLTSKHHDGFCLFESHHANAAYSRPWNSVNVGPKRDIVDELSKAVKKKGIAMGLYYSLYEWFHPYWKFLKNEYVERHMQPQLRELVEIYRPQIIFADGEWGLTSSEWRSTQFLAWLFNNFGTKVVVNDRWGSDTKKKYGSYFTTEYTGGLSLDVSRPWEENRGIGYSFGFNRNEGPSDYKTSKELILMLIDIVSRGGNLLLNIGPCSNGSIPLIMQDRLRKIGKFLINYGEAIYETRPWKVPSQWSEGYLPEIDFTQNFKQKYEISEFLTKIPGKSHIEMFFTAKSDTLFVFIPGDTWPEKPVIFVKEVTTTDRTVVMEIKTGEELEWSVGKREDKKGITVTLDPLVVTQCEPACVLKITNVF